MRGDLSAPHSDAGTKSHKVQQLKAHAAEVISGGV